MKAQVFYGPGDLRFEEMPVPEPALGEIVIRVEAALTCGTDVKVLRRGHPVMIPHVPTVFGHEFAGTVARLGRGVTTLREGDRVVAANSAPCGACRCCRSGRQNLCEDLLFVNGGYGEYLALPPRLVATNVVRLGPSLPARRAAFAEPLACALLGIERGRVESGMTVAASPSAWTPARPVILPLSCETSRAEAAWTWPWTRRAGPRSGSRPWPLSGGEGPWYSLAVALRVRR